MSVQWVFLADIGILPHRAVSTAESTDNSTYANSRIFLSDRRMLPLLRVDFLVMGHAGTDSEDKNIAFTAYMG